MTLVIYQNVFMASVLLIAQVQGSGFIVYGSSHVCALPSGVSDLS